jgi:predicted double-glycine peptidase
MSVGLVGSVPTAAVVAALSFLGGVTARAETAERILDVPFVSQSENLCGGAAVAMVLRYWGERGVFAEDFSPFLNASGSGIATDQLVEAVEARGTSAFSFHPDEASARHHLDVGRPLVVLLEVGPDRYHYVVLVGFSAEKDEVIVHDPVWGAFRRFESEAFRERWSGSGRWALLILPDESGNEPSLADSEPPETQRQHPCRGSRCGGAPARRGARALPRRSRSSTRARRHTPSPVSKRCGEGHRGARGVARSGG